MATNRSQSRGMGPNEEGWSVADDGAAIQVSVTEGETVARIFLTAADARMFAAALMAAAESVQKR